MHPLAGHRTPVWVYELLNSSDEPLGRLDGVTGGGCTVAALARLGGSGSLTLDELGQGIDWQSHRIRISYDPGIPEVDPWPVSTMLFTSPKEHHTEFGLSYEVALLPKMQVIDEDTVEDRYSLDVGAPIISTVVALIQSTGETRVAVTPSDAVLTSGLTWEAGTSKLAIINDLMQAAGYWSLWCDGSGLFRVEPYVNPADRPIAWTFEHGEWAVHAPDWSREQDMSSVPNRFLAVGHGDEETEPLVGVALNENPDSPYSFQARGRWVTASETNVEAESQEVIDQYAARKLLDAMSPVSRLEVGHAVLPLNPNELVRFIPEDGTPRLATVQSMKFRFEFDADCDAEWREVIPV